MTLNNEWDSFVAAHPGGHILQTSAWGELKAAFGWHVETVRVRDSGALVLFRPLPLGLGTFAYIPKGPLVDWKDPTSLASLLPALDAGCRAHRAAFVKIEPDLVTPNSKVQTPNPQSAIRNLQSAFLPSRHSIQPRRTIIVDISGDEQTILAAMKAKCRYNIGLAQKKGVTVRASNDLATFNRLMQTTGTRDNFGVHSPAYYEKAYSLFHPEGLCELLLAEHDGQPLAALMAFALGRRAWYFYGASSGAERNRMPAYLLQWEAIRWAKSKGCCEYDLWGVPDEDEAALEANFESRRDGLWGVYRFKRGFGGALVRSVGAWDRVYNRGILALFGNGT
ncbi:MAG: peptidoglycan bridge formation glycyltransferase FemA/FemB family protein [Chloroflexi bacterium]|nr:peptidoglycan bridge formation glycyltransferase FemA/FemB family protein [Chloroflexota bacterium]